MFKKDTSRIQVYENYYGRNYFNLIDLAILWSIKNSKPYIEKSIWKLVLLY